MLRASAAVLALGFLSAPAMAGEFFSGTQGSSSRYEKTRTSIGSEKLTSTREFENELSGYSKKHFGSITATAENARYGGRSFDFIEGEVEINGQLQGVAGAEGDDGEFEVSVWPFSVETDGEQVVAGAAAGEVGGDIDGMTGSGYERYLDGALSASYEFGYATASYEQEEEGTLNYKMEADFTEIETVDGVKSNSGSVFSFN